MTLSSSSLQVRIATIIDRVLYPPMPRRIFGWGLVSHGFLLVAAFILDVGTGGAVLDRWHAGLDLALGGVQSQLQPAPTTTTFLGLGLAALSAWLTSRFLKLGKAALTEHLLIFLLVAPPWFAHLLPVFLADRETALRFISPVVAWSAIIIVRGLLHGQPADGAS